jgi:hypothetical protein
LAHTSHDAAASLLTVLVLLERAVEQSRVWAKDVEEEECGLFCPSLKP